MMVVIIIIIVPIVMTVFRHNLRFESHLSIGTHIGHEGIGQDKGGSLDFPTQRVRVQFHSTRDAIKGNVGQLGQNVGPLNTLTTISTLVRQRLTGRHSQRGHGIVGKVIPLSQSQWIHLIVGQSTEIAGKFISLRRLGMKVIPKRFGILLRQQGISIRFHQPLTIFLRRSGGQQGQSLQRPRLRRVPIESKHGGHLSHRRLIANPRTNGIGAQPKMIGSKQSLRCSVFDQMHQMMRRDNGDKMLIANRH
mmetsp:Transcript_1177/g.2547  ORF Transcript_1177/g.2547 Transcript_1177/m.2547 type:complete len:249 (+) Transcript_1177:379-1125(+)